MTDSDQLIYENSNTYRLHADNLRWALLGSYAALLAGVFSFSNLEIKDLFSLPPFVSFTLFLVSFAFLWILAVQNWFYNLFANFVDECELRLFSNQKLRPLQAFAREKGPTITPFHPAFFFAELLVSFVAYWFLVVAIKNTHIPTISQTISGLDIEYQNWMVVVGFLLYFGFLNLIFMNWDKTVYKSVIVPISNLYRLAPAKPAVKKKENNDLRLLCILAHPDDESLGLGFTLAKYAAEGVEVSLVTATRGERGWSGKEEDNPGLAELGRIRENELRCAAAKLGLHEVVFLDYIDGEVDQANPREAAEKIAAQVRRIRPQVVIAFDFWGIYGHPDHIAVTQFTQAGLLLAANPAHKDPAGYLPFQVQKFYLEGDSVELVEVIKDLLGGITIPVDGVERGHYGWPAWALSTHVDGTAYWDQVMEAIACHTTQVSEFLPALQSLPKKYPPQVYSIQHFVRVFSLVNGGRQAEDDLFEGLR